MVAREDTISWGQFFFKKKKFKKNNFEKKNFEKKQKNTEGFFFFFFSIFFFKCPKWTWLQLWDVLYVLIFFTLLLLLLLSQMVPKELYFLPYKILWSSTIENILNLHLRFFFRFFFFQMSQMNTVAALRCFIRLVFFQSFFYNSFFKGSMHRRLGGRIDSPHFLARMPSILGRVKPWPNFQGIMQNCIVISMSLFLGL